MTLAPAWKLGQSGNPGGRPKGLARATRELVGDDGLPLAMIWWEIAQNPKHKDRLRASELLADRGWGKASPLPEVKTDDPLELDVSESAIGRIVDELAARREATLTGPPANGKVAADSKNGAAPTKG